MMMMMMHIDDGDGGGVGDDDDSNAVGGGGGGENYVYLLLQTKEFWLDYNLITWTYIRVSQVVVHNLNWILSLDYKFILSEENINTTQFKDVKSIAGMYLCTVSGTR